MSAHSKTTRVSIEHAEALCRLQQKLPRINAVDFPERIPRPCAFPSARVVELPRESRQFSQPLSRVSSIVCRWHSSSSLARVINIFRNGRSRSRCLEGFYVGAATIHDEGGGSISDVKVDGTVLRAATSSVNEIHGRGRRGPLVNALPKEINSEGKICRISRSGISTLRYWMNSSGAMMLRCRVPTR